MSAVTRLTLVTHAITDAGQEARFPADEPLNPLGLSSVEKVGGLPASGLPSRHPVGPNNALAHRAMDTAAGECVAE